jgi:hypothetical protein
MNGLRPLVEISKKARQKSSVSRTLTSQGVIPPYLVDLFGNLVLAYRGNMVAP